MQDRKGVGVHIERRLEWVDTDAAGHQHNSVILRWAESAEAELMRSLRLPEYFPSAPRVKQTVNYHRPLWFGDQARIHLWIAAVGRTSMTMNFTVHTLAHGADSELVAQGEVIVAHTDSSRNGATPWPDNVRRAMLGESDSGVESSGDRAHS